MGTHFSHTSGIYRLKNVCDLPVAVAVNLLKLWFRIPPTAWMFICCDFCVCCDVGIYETSCSLVQRIPTEFRGSLCVI